MRRHLLSFLLPIVFLLACQVSEEEKIYQMLNRRQEKRPYRKEISPFTFPVSPEPIKIRRKTLTGLRSGSMGILKPSIGLPIPVGIDPSRSMERKQPPSSNFI
jgi:hypothetical protein